MKKYSKLLAVTLCASIALASTGCSATNKLKNAITNKKTTSDTKKESAESVKCLDYVTLGDYSTIKIKKSEIDKSTKEQVEKNIKSTGDYKKVKTGKVKKGDIVNIYYVGKINGKTFDGGSLTKKTNKAGYDLEMLNAVCDTVDIPVIASGGCGSIQDIIDVFEKTNVDAALVASLFHFNEATVEDVRNECKKHGINVRRTR